MNLYVFSNVRRLFLLKDVYVVKERYLFLYYWRENNMFIVLMDVVIYFKKKIKY